MCSSSRSRLPASWLRSCRLPTHRNPPPLGSPRSRADASDRNHQFDLSYGRQNRPTNGWRTYRLDFLLILLKYLCFFRPCYSVCYTATQAPFTSKLFRLMLKRSLVNGRQQLELTEWIAALLEWYKAQGCFTASIRYRTRLFLQLAESAPTISALRCSRVLPNGIQ